MFETTLTVIGNIVTDPIRRRVGEHELIKFRVASNSRRRGADGSWETGNTLFITVNCWDRLVTGVGASLSKGLPVIVVGHVFTSEYEDKDGVRRSSVELRATAVGPDLARCAARVEKIIAAGPDSPLVAARGEHADGPDSTHPDADADAGAEMTGMALAP
ncbi:single-stranded DNA-binding protein [Mycolicibacter hiberniae]|uniref:Single-stranded DNA-binding protein n=1 Tax=Mycolicibacter hiberniae TaxID=29314 RepID=A0A7I7X0U5_9MYCO|nr:single-stranded DNA-binding protein [Mycolicibacter hiberniae]MCV7085460.1 single-stranded DNA-binding protein [Mycolicibacter hiberniae]ORV71254.1 single-stranded DNA-binding protein [Mycolicibacter hiberniae]BBZ22467.1 single-stranded DNA-binding protein [Mycolicibacter hiberniae]